MPHVPAGVALETRDDSRDGMRCGADCIFPSGLSGIGRHRRAGVSQLAV